MSVKDNVLALRDQYRPDLKTVSELERAMKLSNGIISQWDKSEPTKQKAEQVANFFKVPVERVYGIESNSVTLDSEEENLVALFRKQTSDMSVDDRKRFNKSLDSLMKTAKNLLEDK